MSSFEALKGIKVLSLTQFLLGPSGVQFLSDLGAEVIKVEPVKGAYERHWSGADLRVGGESMFYMLANRNVQSVALDLKRPEAQEIALKLAAEADVVVQNFRPGVAERLGLSYDAVRAVNPDVIYVSASGYGEEGPYRKLPGQDLLLQAMSGLASITGSADRGPTPVGTAVIDQHGASLLALGVVTALFRRERTGAGEHVEIAMARAALDLQLESISYQLNGASVERSDAGLGSGFHQAPYGIYPTADGDIAISLSPITKVAAAVGSEALAAFADPACAWTNKKEIADLLREALAHRGAREWEDVLREHDVWAQRVNDYADAVNDPVIRSLNAFETCHDPDRGEVTFLRSPIRFSGADSETRIFPARLGADTAGVMRDLGYSDERISVLEASGIVGLPQKTPVKQDS